MFTIELEGVAELEQAWGSATNLIRDGVSKGVAKGVKEGAQEARSKHTFQNRTGELEKSIEGVALGWRDGMLRCEGVIRATAKHASFVDEGTKPHVIVVRRARWLSWEESQGDRHFAVRVNHPGTKAQPFMHHAYFKCERVILREIESGVAAAQGALNR